MKQIKLGKEFTLENINKIQKDKTPKIIEFLMGCLKDHFVFYNLNET